MKTNLYNNLEVQFNKIFRHLKTGSFKTRERYAKAFKRFMVYLASEYNLQKLSNIAPKHIFSYVEYMQGKEMSAATIKTEFSAIRFFHDNIPYKFNIVAYNCKPLVLFETLTNNICVFPSIISNSSE